MSQTAQAVVQNLVDRAVKLGDRQLAADIRAFAAQRQFGLVFEHNRPERLRLYGKPIMKGDVVKVLPERAMCIRDRDAADHLAVGLGLLKVEGLVEDFERAHGTVGVAGKICEDLLNTGVLLDKTSAPVSYTHLDVYKRQVPSSLRARSA